MRLAQQGTPGLDPSAGSIIHFYHFRRWRESGVAYELRDCRYNEVNRSMLSIAYGTRKEYTDRSELQFTMMVSSCSGSLSMPDVADCLYCLQLCAICPIHNFMLLFCRHPYTCEMKGCQQQHLLPGITGLTMSDCVPSLRLTCRLGNDKGRSVSAWGFWGDILNSPYHSFGTSCSERSFFKISNKQFVHTAVSVAEYNVTVCSTRDASTDIWKALSTWPGATDYSLLYTARLPSPIDRHQLMLTTHNNTYISTPLHLQLLCTGGIA